MRSLRLLVMLVVALTVTGVVLTQRAHAFDCLSEYNDCLNNTYNCDGCISCGLAYEACQGTDPYDPQCYEYGWCSVYGYCGGGPCPY
jgi:hypothetical protein